MGYFPSGRLYGIYSFNVAFTPFDVLIIDFFITVAMSIIF